MSTAIELLLADCAASREYRAGFVVAHAKHSIPLQIADLMKQQGLNQSKLAREADVSQSTVSRALDPDYGDLTVNTLVRIAAGFDVAFICGFVPFSEFFKWVDETSGEREVASFTDEYGDLEGRERQQQETVAALERKLEEFSSLTLVVVSGEGDRPKRPTQLPLLLFDLSQQGRTELTQPPSELSAIGDAPATDEALRRAGEQLAEQAA